MLGLLVLSNFLIIVFNMSNLFLEKIVFAGEVGFLNGLLPINLSDPKVFLPESVEEQSRQIMRNLDELLIRQSLKREQIVAVQVFLKDFHRFYARFEAIASELFGSEISISKNVVGVVALPRDALISMNFVIRANL
jgi:enamine deaminase RidA (YjgF/YER057c/UK114 family)